MGKTAVLYLYVLHSFILKTKFSDTHFHMTKDNVFELYGLRLLSTICWPVDKLTQCFIGIWFVVLMNIESL